MLMIRLRRGGAKKKPIYRVVVSDSRKTPKADYLDQVGFYDPNQEPPEIRIDLEKVDEWQNQGAGVSDTVKSLILKAQEAAAVIAGGVTAPRDVSPRKEFPVSAMKELLEEIAKALVDNPEDVQVTEVEGEQTTVLELRVRNEDLGKVIGRQGRTARAIRTLLSAAGMKIHKRFVLEILE